MLIKQNKNCNLSVSGERYFPLFVASILILIFSSRLFAASPVFLNEKIKELDLQPHLEILKDPEKKLTIKDFNSSNISDRFIHSIGKYPVFTFSSAAYWIRFRVISSIKNDYIWYMEISNPMLNNINIYIMDSRGKIVRTESGGDLLPFNHRKINHRNFVYKFLEKAGKEQVYYIRIQTESLINLSFSMISEERFQEKNDLEHIALGIYFGALIVMIIYNLFIFLSIRDRSYLYYVIYYFVYMLFNLSLTGLAYQYLWPDSIWWTTKNIPVYMFLLTILGIQFSRSFLELPRRIPEHDNIFKALMIISSVLIPATFFVNYSIIIRAGISIMMITIVLVFVTLYRMMSEGFRPARYFLLSWMFLCAGTTVYALKSFSLIPDNFISRITYQGASILEVVIITLGLADRISFRKKESEDIRMNLENLVNRRTDELNTALEKMERKDKEMQMELSLAANIQVGILPQTPCTIRGINIDAYLSAMGKVSGDFYDIFQMSGGYVGIIIGDVSGHGMPAAFITAMAKINFSEAIQNNLFPADIFRQVNRELVKVIKTDDFLTSFFVVISPSFEIFYCNASHQLPMVLRKPDLDIVRWDTNGLFLGALDIANDMYVDGRDQLNYGDRLLLFSDGIIESRNSRNETFGEKRLSNLLIETSDMPFNDSRNKIIDEWKKFTENREQIDDVSFVLVEIDPSYKNLINYREDGFKMLTMGKIKDAIEILKLAIDIDNNDEKSHLYLGECYLKDKNYIKSIEHLNKYLYNNEIDANVWYHLAQAYFNMGNYTMANETALKAAQLRNDSADVLVLSGLSLRDLGHHKEAKKVWERLLMIESNNQLALTELALIRKIENKSN